MAKKFVNVSTGLSTVFSSIAAGGKCTIKTDAAVKAVADSESILYITAGASDATTFGQRYAQGSHWIWALGQLFDGNDTSTTYFTAITGIDGDIAGTDNIETIVRKLIKKVSSFDAGVTSLTTTDDAWIVIDPSLNASTGAVTLNVSHALPSTATSGVKGNASTGTASWGGAIGVEIPNVSIDARGHVSATGTDKFNVTLPSTPVTSLTTQSTTDSEVLMTVNSKATGEVTVNASHALHTAQKAGQTADATPTISASTFKVLEVSTNGTGHVISATAHTITLPATAFSDTVYVHPAAQTGSASAVDGQYVSAVTVDASGHVTAQASKTNGVYSDDTTSHAANEIAVWSAATNSLKTSDKTIRTAAIDTDSSTTTVPTTSQVIDYVLKNKVQGAMTYKGTKATYAEITALTGMAKGDVWVLSADDTTSGYQKGDTFIYNGSSWDRIPAGDAKVTDLHPDLTFGTDNISIGTIDGVTLHVDMPEETALSVDNKTETTKTGLSFVSAITKGTGSHSLNVSTMTIQDGTTSQKGVVQLDDSSVSTDTTKAATGHALGVVNTLAQSKSTVAYTQTAAATEDSSYLIGTITIDGTDTKIYGHDKDTVYTHPAAPTTGSVNTSTAGTASATTVVTGISRDSSGHIASVTVSDISAAYNQRAVKVNGTEKIAATATTALDISAGKNVTVEYTNSKVVISAADNTDEKVKAEASESKAYLLGQLNASVGTANHATYDTDVYVEAGALHATSLYEGSWSVHDSSAGDWGTL